MGDVTESMEMYASLERGRSSSNGRSPESILGVGGVEADIKVAAVWPLRDKGEEELDLSAHAFVTAT
jgi:hypothetical protein